MPRRWVRIITKWPVLTIVVVDRGAGRDGLSGQRSADRPARQRPGRSWHPGPRHVRPGERTLRGRLQRPADRVGRDRRLRRAARGDGRDRGRHPGAAGCRQCAAGDAQLRRVVRHRPGHPDHRAGSPGDQGSGAAYPRDARAVSRRLRRSGRGHRVHRGGHRRLQPPRRRATAVRDHRGRAVARAAHDGLPLDRGPDQGDHRVPAQRGRRVRRHRYGLQLGLVPAALQRAPDRPGDQLPADLC